MVECEFTIDESEIVDSIVLIDTWWNVNWLYCDAYYKIMSFNRYMVECECI